VDVTKEKLAIDGGTPLRAGPWPAPYYGASVLGDEELALLTEVIAARSPFRAYGEGTPHMVDDFEREACAYFGTRYGLATATGSGSFYCAMAGLGIGPGDEVIIPSFGWYTAFEAPVMLGATPVFADIDRTLNMDPDDFARKITPRTKAVINIYFQGGTNDVSRMLEVARAHGVKVVEDCAQACGTRYQGRPVGSLGDIGCFSLQQNKIISTGDGGLLLTGDPLIFERAARFHDLGFLRPTLTRQLGGKEEVPSFCGGQWRMNEFTGAVALAQLRGLDSRVLDSTRRHFRRIREQIAAECAGLRFRQSGDPAGDAGIVLGLDLETPERAEWMARATAAEGIRIGPASGCKNLLRDPMVQERRMAHPALPPFGPGCPGEHVRYTPDLCPNTDSVATSALMVPLSPLLTDADADDIARAVIKVWLARPVSLFGQGTETDKR
jgi:8-amino-3,8-dideoxy-alpha-D-manno-octulosonate transaminase